LENRPVNKTKVVVVVAVAVAVVLISALLYEVLSQRHSGSALPSSRELTV